MTPREIDNAEKNDNDEAGGKAGEDEGSVPTEGNDDGVKDDQKPITR